MGFDVLADAVVVLHLAFIVFVAVGALLAWRWPALVWAHIPAAVWAIGIVAGAYECPLTTLEQWLRGRAGAQGYEDGFVDRYVEDVIYPEELTAPLRAVVGVMILGGYVRLVRRDPVLGGHGR